MATPRRVGSENSETRAALLDTAERLMLDKGYAAVTYRGVAALAGVAPSLVQYYFPSLDDLFIASIRRRSSQNLARLRAMLEDRPDEPLQVVWEFSSDQISAALLVEFMALANHRKSIRSEIATLTEEVRRVALDAISARMGDAVQYQSSYEPGTVLFLLAAMPKMLRFEQALGLSLAHDDVETFVAGLIDDLDGCRSRIR